VSTRDEEIYVSRHHDQQQATASAPKSVADIDVDAEHDPEVARRASNASLRREAPKSGSAPHVGRGPKALHDASDRKSYDSVESALAFFAKQLPAWGRQLDKLVQSDTSTEAGTEPTIQAIQAIYDTVQHDALRIADLILVADKGERKLLAPDVRKVQGAFTRFWWSTQRVSHWLPHDRQIDASATKRTIDDYTSLIGVNEKMEPDVTETDKTDKKLSQAMLDDQFAATEAALDSVKAGNDTDVARVVLHIRYLNGIAKEHPAEIKAHKAKLTAFLTTLDEIRAAKPDLADRLAEGHNELRALILR
jgi:hypothetical protein